MFHMDLLIYTFSKKFDSEVSFVASIATCLEDLEIDGNNTRASITSSDSNVTLLNRVYTKKIFRNDINKYKSNPRLGGSCENKLDNVLKLL